MASPFLLLDCLRTPALNSLEGFALDELNTAPEATTTSAATSSSTSEPISHHFRCFQRPPKPTRSGSVEAATSLSWAGSGRVVLIAAPWRGWPDRRASPERAHHPNRGIRQDPRRARAARSGRGC